MFAELKTQLDLAGVELVAVSKTKSNEAILELYDQGQRVFGENRVQELAAKYEALPKDIDWHMIGGLQKNKVKYLASFISLIHSVDSLALAKVIDKEAAKNDRVIDVLLQLKVAQEVTKSVYNLPTLIDELPAIMDLPNVRVRGIMGMGTFTDEEEVVRLEFQELVQSKAVIKEKFFRAEPYFDILSMGMSADYQIAVQEGSTMVRIGSLLFGKRY